MENKKKKERRKEKESIAVETSDEEANSAQGNILYLCLVFLIRFNYKFKVILYKGVWETQ